MEWMDLKRYENARQELLLAIKDEPKHVEARYQIALSYNLEGDLSSAIKWCAETLSVTPKHAMTQKLISEISAATEKQLLSSEDRLRATGLVLLRELIDQRFVSPLPIIREKVVPLLRSASKDVVNQSFNLLKREKIEIEGLSMLAKDDDPAQRQKALKLIIASADKEYLPVLRALANDKLEPIREEASLLLLEKYDDSSAKTVLAEIYHAYLQKEIAIGRDEKEGVEFHDRISKILKVSPKLGDASFAREFAELLCVGRIYGFLANGVTGAIKSIGKPGVPHLREVLSREREFRDLLRQKGLRPDQIDWRFTSLKNVIATLEK
jgi:hypothetical protein